MLFMCMMIAALILCESCVPVLSNPDFAATAEEKLWLFEHYGTFENALRHGLES